MIKLINDNFKITSILSRAIPADYLTASLIEQFKHKDILLWQDKNLYFPCKRLQLSYGVDLLKLLKHHIDDFNLLIINHFKDSVGSREIIDFIDTISTMKEMKDKQVILFLSADIDNPNLSDYINLQNVINADSDYIYRLTKHKIYKSQENLYTLEDLRNDNYIHLKETMIKHKIALYEP